MSSQSTVTVSVLPCIRSHIRQIFSTTGVSVRRRAVISVVSISACWALIRSVLDQELEEGAEKKAEEAADAHKAALDFDKETLGDAVKEVKASARLKSHPVCLTAGEGLSFEMEKYFQAVQPDSAIKAERILELNVDHPAFQALEQAVTADPEKAKKYAQLLYDQALLIAGLPLDDPSGYTDLVCELMK